MNLRSATVFGFACLSLASCVSTAESYRLTDSDPIAVTFSDPAILIAKETKPIDMTIFEGRTTKGESEYCTVLTQERVDQLRQAYEGKQRMIYSFYDPALGVDQPLYTVEAFSNLGGYDTMESFKRDFDFCAVAGMYPYALNDQWLVLAHHGCGTGVYVEGFSERCSDASEQIEKGLRLK